LKPGGNAWLECPRCQGTIIDDFKRAMNARGIFVAPGQSIDKDGVITGAALESPTISLWVSGLASPFVTFALSAGAHHSVLETRQHRGGREREPGIVPIDVEIGGAALLAFSR
jgi:phage terminase large subunit GpA-like protein